MGSPAHVVLTNHDTSCLPPYRQSHRLRFHPYARYAPSPVAAAEVRVRLAGRDLSTHHLVVLFHVGARSCFNGGRARIWSEFNAGQRFVGVWLCNHQQCRTSDIHCSLHSGIGNSILPYSTSPRLFTDVLTNRGPLI